MRPFSPRLYRQTVSVQKRLESGPDGSGGEAPAWDVPGTELRASVQAISATSRNSWRTEGPGSVHSETAWIVRTPSDPGAAVDDRFLWLGRDLLVTAPSRPTASDAAGDPVAWATECTERT